MNKVFVKMDKKDWENDSITIPSTEAGKAPTTVKLAVCTNEATAKKVVKDYGSVFVSDSGNIIGKMVFGEEPSTK